MTTYQKRMRANADRRREKWLEKKNHVRQWLIDNDAPQEILDLFDKVAVTPTYTWA